MRYCEYCGAPLDDDALFCTKCGARLSSIQPASSQVVETVDTIKSNVSSTVSDQLQKKEKNIQKSSQNYRMYFFVLFAIILAAGICIAILTLGKKTNDIKLSIDDTEEVVQQQKVNLHGTVDIYPVYMKLTIEGNVVNGSYYYESQGPGKQLNLKGIYDNGNLELFETDENGQQTGHFVGQLKKGIYLGIFYNARGNSMHFRLDK